MADAERDALLRWLLGALDAGGALAALPDGAASPADVDVARLDVERLLGQLRGAAVAGARVDLGQRGALRSCASAPPAVVSESAGGGRKRGERAKRLARYESILLCAFLGQLRGDAAEQKLAELQGAFGMEDDLHEVMWHQLQFSDGGGADAAARRARPSDVHYRFELLRAARPHEFRSREAFAEWVQRQISVYHRGFSAALGWAAPERREEMAGFGEMVKAMFKNVIDVATSDEEVFPDEAYTDALAACSSTTESAYFMLDDAVDPRFRSSEVERPRAYLSYVYPLNTEMYETALEARLEEQDGRGGSWDGPSCAELLQHLQSQLGLTTRMDRLARARVLLLRTARLSDLERRIRGGCRAARREQEVLTEVQKMRDLLAESVGEAPGAGAWDKQAEVAYSGKVRRDVCGFCRDALEDYHEYIEVGAHLIWESLARLLAQCDNGDGVVDDDDDNGGGSGGGAIAPPPVVVGDGQVPMPGSGNSRDAVGGGGDRVSEVAVQCIIAGVRRLYMESEHIAAGDFDRTVGELGAIAEAVAGQLADEAEHSVPFFAAVHPTALRCIAGALAACVRTHYRECCVATEENAQRYAQIASAAGADDCDGSGGGGGGGDGLGDDEATEGLALTLDVVRCIHCLGALDEQLLECGLREDETLLGYKCDYDKEEERASNRFPLLVESWLDEKRDQFDSFVARCIELEEECQCNGGGGTCPPHRNCPTRWAPVLEQGESDVCESSSVLDLFALFSQTVDSFLEMDLPPWESSFLSLLEHIVGAAIAYANRLHESCVSLVPGPPARPRLKRPNRGNQAAGGGRSVAVLAADALRLASGGVGLPRDSAGGGADNDGSLCSVVIRLNNIHYGTRKFKTLWSRLAQKWSLAANPDHGGGIAGSADGSSSEFVGTTPHGGRRLDAMLAGMENSYRTTADDLAAAVARMLVYGEYESSLRGVILDGLYIGAALEDARVDEQVCTLIEAVVLEEDSGLASLLSPSLLPQLLRELRSALLGCYERILLDGGSSRVYLYTDSALLKEDYVSLLATFAQLEVEVDFIAASEGDGEEGGGAKSSRSSRSREEELRQVLGRGGLDACVCSRRVECQGTAPATVFCADCGSSLFCAACSAGLHVGGYASHSPWSFGEPREQARAHALMDLLGTESEELVRQLRDTPPTQQHSRGGGAAVAVDGGDMVRVLAHRDDDAALSYMRQAVANYESSTGGVWDPTGGAGADSPAKAGSAPSTPGLHGGSPAGGMLGRRGSAGSALPWSPGSVGSLLGDVGRAMRR